MLKDGPELAAAPHLCGGELVHAVLVYPGHDGEPQQEPDEDADHERVHLQYSTVQYSTVQYSTVQVAVMQTSVKLMTMMAVQATEMPWGMEQPTATSQHAPLRITSLCTTKTLLNSLFR